MTSPPQSHPNPSINSLTEQMMEEKRINTKQQQQMATSFKGATDVASEVMIMSRLKTAMEEIKVLNETVATLTQKLQQWEEKLIQLKSARIATIPIGNCMTNDWCYK
jgi:hemerythrin superfamily protein